MDLSSWDNTLAVNSTGQSGQLFHAHRDDELSLWKNMQYHSMFFTRKAVESDLASTLKLVPADKTGSRTALAGNQAGNQR